ncbi:MAG: helix-turn-helix domain-containing protein, partial [Bacteroidetes bacterium]
GMGIRQICQQLKVSRNTDRSIIELKGDIPDTPRKDKIRVDEQLLRQLYAECNGWVQRVHEKLTEEEGIQIGYSTLTRMIGELGMGREQDQRCGQVTDEPGAEMQHDTSPYRIKIGGKEVRVAGSLLYFRYSKIRYLKFYRSFNRFKMKCFLHEALTFWGYAAKVCIIDNTNLARLRGSGKNAVMVPEMKHFADQYNFEFICHEIGHSNRKAGNERGFFTVVTNFFSGRSFESLEDLNTSALDWATGRMANRPVGKSGLIPARAFEDEKPFLKKLPSYVPAPYLLHKRQTDQYGYVSFDGNFYWVPGSSLVEVTLLQYSNKLTLYHQRKLLAEYDLPVAGVKNERFWPKGQSKPQHQPRHRKNPTTHEEQNLRAVSGKVSAYLDFALKASGKPKHRFLRQLYSLQQKMALPLFVKSIERALIYRITDLATLERIAVLLMRGENHKLQFVEVDPLLENRSTYLEGRFTDEVDFSYYEKMLDKEQDDG